MFKVITSQVTQLVRLAFTAKKWTVPLVIGGKCCFYAISFDKGSIVVLFKIIGAWFVFPGLTKGFLIDVGLESAPPAKA